MATPKTAQKAAVAIFRAWAKTDPRRLSPAELFQRAVDGTLPADPGGRRRPPELRQAIRDLQAAAPDADALRAIFAAVFAVLDKP